ncbi:chemotaxis protein CheW [Pannus brasiliensis CCIBt3594]|uniref:Chemotaxis protein CheW n=1 Tax=Pannus brasiliensis CCIBt3594 TaxID=1427578 RepID=A0AAW9QVH7_9CHRO
MTFSGSKLPATDNRDSREQYLRFYLHPDTTAMLPVARLTEVLTIPVGQIVPIPHLPSWVMGVYNWRGEILWMVDLGELLGLAPWYQKAMNATNHRAIVLHSETSGKRDRGQAIGLLVDRVEDIEYCDTERIQSPPASMVTMNLAPYLRGYWMKGNGDMILTLDGTAILAAMPRG